MKQYYHHLSPMPRSKARAYLNVLLYFYPIIQRVTEDIFENAIRLAANHIYRGPNPGTFIVPSQNMKDATYYVQPDRKSCTCASSSDTNICEHRLAVGIYKIAFSVLCKLKKSLSPADINEILEGRAP